MAYEGFILLASPLYDRVAVHPGIYIEEDKRVKYKLDRVPMQIDKHLATGIMEGTSFQESNGLKEVMVLRMQPNMRTRK